MRGEPVEPPFACASDLDDLGGVIRKAQARQGVVTFESALSTLTFAIASIERLSDLDAEQINRLRQAVIRLSNAERKASK